MNGLKRPIGVNMTEETKVEESTEPVYKNFDPKQIEQELLEQAQQRADDPAESAATAYQMYVPHYKRLLPKMSTRSLRRILNFVVLYPFEQDSVKSANELEKQFMQLVNSLVEAKFVMIMATFNDSAQQLLDAQSEPLTKEQTDGIIAELKASGVTEDQLAEAIKRNEGEV